jgi:hypothetical protein
MRMARSPLLLPRTLDGESTLRHHGDQAERLTPGAVRTPSSTPRSLR